MALVTIRESECIGCTKCIQACPVDAILGSMNQMHTVITTECIGCELCVPPCPVDCIDLVENVKPTKNKELTLKRVKARKQRLSQNETLIPNETPNISAKPPLKIHQTLARIKELKASR